MINIINIQESYGFKNAVWEIEGEMIKTDKGLKRVSFWSDEESLLWNVKWRDQLASQTGILTDRMIQTLKGERMILTEEGWITLHDNVTSLFPYKNREKEMGKYFGQYFSMTVGVNIDYEEPINVENIYSRLNKPLLKKVSGELLPFVDGLRREALIRLSKAKRFCEEAIQDGVVPPVVSPILSLDQGKIVFEKLYWQHGNEKPEKGYRSIQIILSQWLQRYGRKSLFTLLHEIDNHYPIRKVHYKYLLADCLAPWEFTLFLDQLSNIKDIAEVEVLREKLTFQWEESRQLVKALSEWLDLTREKVPSV